MLDPNDLSPQLWNVYSHHFAELNELDYSGDRPHLSCEDVLDTHYLIGEHFWRLGEGIGGFGPKDMGLLSSAVARQVASAGGTFVYQDLWDIAAALVIGLITNHPFHDANKRTAFLSSVFFMLENGFVPRVDIREVEDFTVEVAEFNNTKGRHPRVEDISARFKTMFRDRDNRISYIITYRELSNILKLHGFKLDNAYRNYIDVMKDDQRITKIGYPGETREVSRQVIAQVRKATGLTAENGYDAQVFFKGEDPLNVLIGEYEEPLKRLADR